MQTVSSALQVISTETKNAPLYTNVDYLSGASISLNIISAQQVLATATDAESQASATAVIEAAVSELADLKFSKNVYSEVLEMWPNALFTGIFGMLLLLHSGILVWSRYFYFGGVFFCGCGLSFAGYLGRSISVDHEDELNPFLVQIICLTISPAFIMAGIYYVLGRMLVLHGEGFSILKPRWFSYIFVCCDVVSLVIQAAGGGLAAIAVIDRDDTLVGTNVMVGGIAFQVVSMTLFYINMLEFIFKIYFRNSPEVKFSFKNFFALFFNTNHGQKLRELLEPNYDAKFQAIRDRRLFPYIPAALYAATFFIYIRCVYRLVELSQGWTGFLITHEEFLFALDALQVCLTCIVMLVFSPIFIWGPRHSLKLLDRQGEKNDIESGDNFVFVGDDRRTDESECESTTLFVVEKNVVA